MIGRVVALLLSMAVLIAAPAPEMYPCAPVVWRIAEAITLVENVRAELNNPGGLTGRAGLIRYKSRAQGEAAMLRLMARHTHRSPEGLMKRWAPDATIPYGAIVARRARLQRNKPIKEQCR